MGSLEELRKRIDDVDETLVNLLNERAKIVVEIGKFKRKEKDAPPIYAPDRERAVLDKIKAANKGPLPDRCLLAIYRELMSGSFFLERPLRIAYLGPNGSFSHLAAMQKFGQSVEYEPQPDIRGVFDEVARNHCDQGVVPVENTAAGGVIETLDAFVDTPIQICAELVVAIHHNVLANCPLEEIERVYSKPEVFAQCRNWLGATLPEAQRIAVASTAVAAQTAAREPRSGALGSQLAAELYDLKVVRENIEDRTDNQTRFLVLGRETARPTGNDKTSIMFSTADKAGALVDCLAVFRRHAINLSNIESHPNPGRERSYYFFVDCQGHQSSTQLQQALTEVRTHCLHLGVLGSYPRATEVL